MRSAAGALSWLAYQDAHDTTGWHNSCERACRTAYGLAARFPSASAHARAIPKEFRHGHERPSAGDLLLIVNNSVGHIGVFDGNGWAGYSTDYRVDGQISRLADLRNTIPWAHGDYWFVADAWWGDNAYVRTHKTVAVPTIPTVRLHNLRYGVLNNDDVRDLQRALNRHNLSPDLPVSGNYLALTDAAVRKCQQMHGFGNDDPLHSYVGARQAAHLGLRVI